MIKIELKLFSFQVDEKITITKLKPANDYRFSVFTVSSDDEETLSIPIQAVFMTANDPPADFAAVKVTPISALLTWTPPISLTSEYHLVVFSKDHMILKSNLPGASISYQLEGLSEGTEFTASLKSIPRENEGLAPPTEVEIKFQTTFPAPEGYSLKPGVKDLQITFTHSHSNEITFKETAG